LWRCGDGLFFGVPPLASDALLKTLHPFLENVLQTAASFRKIVEQRDFTRRRVHENFFLVEENLCASKLMIVPWFLDHK
jgi:hypothetical protein